MNWLACSIEDATSYEWRNVCDISAKTTAKQFENRNEFIKRKLCVFTDSWPQRFSSDSASSTQKDRARIFNSSKQGTRTWYYKSSDRVVQFNLAGSLQFPYINVKFPSKARSQHIPPRIQVCIRTASNLYINLTARLCNEGK